MPSIESIYWYLVVLLLLHNISVVSSRYFDVIYALILIHLLLHCPLASSQVRCFKYIMGDSDDLFDNALLIHNVHGYDFLDNDDVVHDIEDTFEFEHANKKRKPSSSQKNCNALSVFQKKPSKTVEIDGLKHEFEMHYQCSKRFLYTFKHWSRGVSSLRYVLYYRCSKRWRGCNASVSLTYSPSDMDYSNETFGLSVHSCGEPLGKLCSTSVITELKSRALKLQLDRPYVAPTQIAREVLSAANLEQGFECQWSLSVSSLRQYLMNNKRESVNHWLSRVQNPPLSIVGDSDFRPFLQFVLTCNIKQKPSVLIGWGHPQALLMAKSGPMHFYIDGTFKCVPRGFKQLITILCFDDRTKLFMPLFFTLAQSKDAEIYSNLLYLCQQSCGYTMKPKTFTSDFEPGIYNSIKRHFPKTRVVGCLFHFVQALRRRLKKVHSIPDPIANVLIGDPAGLCRLLCVIPVDDIQTKGIPYIEMKLAECIDVTGNFLFIVLVIAFCSYLFTLFYRP